MPRMRRQIRSQKPSPVVEKVLKPVARSIKFAGEKAISGYLGATNKLAKKVASVLPAQKPMASRKRRQVR